MRGSGIAMRLEGTFPERGVVISNHTGYLDIMTFAASQRCVFVSKSEMADVPLLGWMTTMAGTVYVERGRGGSALRARGEIQVAADAGLLGQVLEAGQQITAAYVTYRLTEDNGPGVTIENDVCYWGDDVSLFRHIFGLLALRGVEVNMRIGEKPIAFTADALHRKQAAIEARAAVMELGGVRDAVTAV
jgi:1-acyl-sn-glycerol-3-phosphate acyltransferase